MHKRRIYKAHPDCRWRTLRSRAHSSRVYHTSDPVPVCRPALLDCRRSRTLSGGLTPDPASQRRPPRQARDLRLALLLTLGSANTWCEDLHFTSYVPCLAHTSAFRRAVKRRLEGFVGPVHRARYDLSKHKRMRLIALAMPVWMKYFQRRRDHSHRDQRTSQLQCLLSGLGSQSL